MKEKRLAELFELHIQKKCSPSEERELLQLLLDPNLQRRKNELADGLFDAISNDTSLMNNLQADAIFNSILAEAPSVALNAGTRSTHFPPAEGIRFLKTAWFRYAAVLLLVAAAAAFLYNYNSKPQKEVAQQQSPVPDVQPGGNRALLTLADGSTIVLDNAANGNLADQGNTKILKLDGGSLAYQPGKANGKVMHNTISTPKGGQYQIILPDGSKVWLNASSSIRFPTAFTSGRPVTITGEAYLEVAPDKTRPFIVKAAGTEVQVLGTAFNINAYPDEASVKTTLVEGSVKIAGNILKPGQAFKNGELVSTNVEQDVAWKNGLFDFQDKDLREVMRQLARWYNIEVIYENGIPEVEFGGQMGRDLKLSTVLTFLKKTNIHFKLEGNTLTVMP